MIVAIVISTGVTIYFVYFNGSLIKNNISCTKFNAYKETIIYQIQHINEIIKTNKY